MQKMRSLLATIKPAQVAQVASTAAVTMTVKPSAAAIAPQGLPSIASVAKPADVLTKPIQEPAKKLIKSQRGILEGIRKKVAEKAGPVLRKVVPKALAVAAVVGVAYGAYSDFQTVRGAVNDFMEYLKSPTPQNVPKQQPNDPLKTPQEDPNKPKKDKDSKLATSTGGAEVAKDAEKKIEWTNHIDKHKSPKNMSWKDIVEYTRHGDAKYKPGTNIEQLERLAWEKGTPVNNGRPWKVIEFDSIVGAKNGIETKYVRVEMNTNTIHGHPITPQEFLKYTKIIK
jgi:hypothetical protein